MKCEGRLQVSIYQHRACKRPAAFRVEVERGGVHHLCRYCARGWNLCAAATVTKLPKGA